MPTLRNFEKGAWEKGYLHEIVRNWLSNLRQICYIFAQPFLWCKKRNTSNFALIWRAIFDKFEQCPPRKDPFLGIIEALLGTWGVRKGRKVSNLKNSLWNYVRGSRRNLCKESLSAYWTIVIWSQTAVHGLLDWEQHDSLQDRKKHPRVQNRPKIGRNVTKERIFGTLWSQRLDWWGLALEIWDAPFHLKLSPNPFKTIVLHTGCPHCHLAGWALNVPRNVENCRSLGGPVLSGLSYKLKHMSCLYWMSIHNSIAFMGGRPSWLAIRAVWLAQWKNAQPSWFSHCVLHSTL